MTGFGKIISCALALSVMCQALPVLAADNIIYSQAYDSEKTNVIPKGYSVSGSSATRVVEDGSRNKAFFISTQYKDNCVEIPLGAPGEKYTIAFSMKREGGAMPLNISLTDSEQTKLRLLKCTEDGVFKLSDGKAIGTISDGKYTQFFITIDTENGYYGIKIGKRDVDYWPLSDKTVGDITLSFESSAREESKGLYIDDLTVCEGTSRTKRVAAEQYNPSAMEYFEEDESAVSQRVYFNNDFENEETALDGINAIRAGANIVEVRRGGNNSYLYMNRTENANAYANISIGETSSNVVWEMDVRINTPGVEAALMRITDAVTNTASVASNLLSVNNMVLRGGGRNIATMASGKWYNFAAAVNLTMGTYDLYMNGEKIVSQASFSSSKFRVLSSLRIYTSSGTGDLLIDNVKIYDGTQPRDISNDDVVRESIYENDSLAEAFMKNKSGVNPYTGFVYTNGERKRLAAAPVIENGKIYLGEQDLKDFLGSEISLAAAERISDNGEGKYLLDDAVESSGKYVYNDEHGGYIAANSEFEANSNTLSAAHRRISFQRPDAETLKKDLAETNGAAYTKHPRILATAEDFDRVKTEIRENERKKEWYDCVLETTEEIMTAPVSVYEKADGLRILSVASEFERRMLNLGFCWQITGDTRYSDRAWKEIEAVLNFPDWNAKSHFLDTGALSMGFALAYDWFYDAWSEEERSRMYEAALKNGLSQHYNATYGNLGGDASFTKAKTNWSPVCHGGIMNLAFAVAEHDPDYCMEIVSNALRGLEYVFWYYAPDGAWHEGTGYWQLLTNYTVRLLCTMNTALGTDYGMSSYMGLDKLAYFVPSMAGPTGLLYNFHDTGGDTRSEPGMFWLAKRYSDPTIAALRLKYMNEHNEEPTVRDILWCDNAWEAGGAATDKDKLYKGLEMVLMRASFEDNDSSFLAYHGAETKGGHNHYDAGSFVYELDNVRWFVDLGIENACYYDDYSKRGDYYRIRAEGHNTVVINPSEAAGQDTDGYAPITRYETSDSSALSVIDLSSDYKETTNKYERGFLLSDNRRVLTVRDEISLKEESEMYWFGHTTANVEIIGNNTAILTSDNKQLKVEFATDAEEYDLSVMNAEPMATSPNPSGQTSNASYKKLAMKIKGKGAVSVTVKMSMLNENVSDLPIYTEPIEQWTLSEGAADSRPAEEPVVDMINIDGKPIEEWIYRSFDSGEYIYEINLVGTKEIPAVEAVSAGYKTEAVNSYFADGTPYTLVKVFAENGYYTPYIIKYKLISTDDMEFGDYRRLVVYNSAASDIPEPQNTDKHAYDGSLQTRWSAETGNWLEYDLGTSQRIDAVTAAFFSGSVRQTSFDILVSEDGESYTKVLSAVSSGTTDDYEIYKLDEPVNARYVRFLGYGNSVNTWNSVTEFGALSLK